MKKLAKAQFGKVISKTANVFLKKRTPKQVFTGFGATVGGVGTTAAVMTNKAKKELAESESKKKADELKKKSATVKPSKKIGGSIKTKKSK